MYFSNFQKCQHYVGDFERVYLGNKGSQLHYIRTILNSKGFFWFSMSK